MFLIFFTQHAKCIGKPPVRRKYFHVRVCFCFVFLLFFFSAFGWLQVKYTARLVWYYYWRKMVQHCLLQNCCTISNITKMYYVYLIEVIWFSVYFCLCRYSKDLVGLKDWQLLKVEIYLFKALMLWVTSLVSLHNFISRNGSFLFILQVRDSLRSIKHKDMSYNMHVAKAQVRTSTPTK